MTEIPAEQAAYETWAGPLAADIPYDQLTDTGKAKWRAVVRAVRRTRPGPAAGPAPALLEELAAGAADAAQLKAERDHALTVMRQAQDERDSDVARYLDQAASANAELTRLRTTSSELEKALASAENENRRLKADLAQARDRETTLARQAEGLTAGRDQADRTVRQLARIHAARTRSMYAAWIDCRRGDTSAAAAVLSEALDGFGGTRWDGTETGTQWLERTRTEEGL